MRQSLTAILIALVLAAPTSAQDAPTIDHHQHLYSPGIAALISPPAPAARIAPIDGGELIALLDAAGIREERGALGGVHLRATDKDSRERIREGERGERLDQRGGWPGIRIGWLGFAA